MEKLIQTYIVAGVVIKQDGKYLLVQEGNHTKQVYGLWNFPAGRVEAGDSIEKTAVKEAKEESGYDVELISKIDIFQASAEEPPKHAFAARIIGGELKWPKDEILDARWFTLQEIKNMGEKLRGEWILGAINIMEIEKKKIGVSQKAIIYNESGSILTIRRTETARSWPLHWDLPGGELEYGENAEVGMAREIKEETGLEVDYLSVIDINSSFDDNQEFWVTICYTARTKMDKIVLSYEHDEIKWATPDEFLELKASLTNKKFVERFKFSSEKK